MTKIELRLRATERRMDARWRRLKNFAPDKAAQELQADCFARSDGECMALTHKWCDYEECRFYKPKSKEATDGATVVL